MVNVKEMKANPDKWFVYHTGYLPRDKRADPYLALVARRYLELAEKGTLVLVQKRLGNFDYEYLVKWSKHHDRQDRKRTH